MMSILCFAFSPAASAQPLSIGVKGGVRLSNDFTGFADTESKRYVVGPMVTAKLPFGFLFEADALYRRMAYRTSSANPFGYSHQRSAANSWEFPLLVRHGLFHGLYASAGYVPRVIRGNTHYHSYSILDLAQGFVYTTGGYTTNYQTSHGVIGALGISKHAGPFHIEPEFRYTHWNRPAIEVYGSRGYYYANTQEQFDILIGIRFP